MSFCVSDASNFFLRYAVNLAENQRKLARPGGIGYAGEDSIRSRQLSRHAFPGSGTVLQGGTCKTAVTVAAHTPGTLGGGHLASPKEKLDDENLKPGKYQRPDNFLQKPRFDQLVVNSSSILKGGRA